MDSGARIQLSWSELSPSSERILLGVHSELVIQSQVVESKTELELNHHIRMVKPSKAKLEIFAKCASEKIASLQKF